VVDQVPRKSFWYFIYRPVCGFKVAIFFLMPQPPRLIQAGKFAQTR